MQHSGKIGLVNRDRIVKKPQYRKTSCWLTKHEIVFRAPEQVLYLRMVFGKLD